MELIDRMLLESGELSVEEQNRFYPREQSAFAQCVAARYMKARETFLWQP